MNVTDKSVQSDQYISGEQMDSILDALDPVNIYRKHTRPANFFDVLADVHTPVGMLKLRKLPTTSVYRNPLQDGLRIRGYFAKALKKLNLPT